MFSKYFGKSYFGKSYFGENNFITLTGPEEVIVDEWSDYFNIETNIQDIKITPFDSNGGQFKTEDMKFQYKSRRPGTIILSTKNNKNLKNPVMFVKSRK